MRFAEDELGVDPDELIETLAVDRIRTVGNVVAMGAPATGAAAEGPGT